MSDFIGRTSNALARILARNLSPDAIALELHNAGLLRQTAYTPARLAKDIQELEATPERTVIRSAAGDIYERQGHLETEHGTFAAWLGTLNELIPSNEIRLPATVIYEPSTSPWEHPGHKTTQHRDGNPPWCKTCGWTTPHPGTPAQKIREGNE